MRLLTGPDPQALLDTCLAEISQVTATWPDRRAFLIVPETMKADCERRYLAQPQAKGLMMAEVLSFRRLSYRLFAEVGGLAVQSVSQTGKIMLIQHLLEKHNADFRRFGHLAGLPAYASELDQVLGDFRRYAFTADELYELAEQVSQARTRDKLFDFATLLRHLQAELESRQLFDREQDPDRLVALLKQRPLPARLQFLEQTSVWVAGFGGTRDFTTQELALIESLRAIVHQLTVLLPEGGMTWARLQSDEARSGRVAAPFLQAVSQTVPDRRNPFFVQLADPTAEAVAPDRFAAHVQVVRAADSEQELLWVAGEIRRLLRERQLKRRDIGIAVCQPSVVAGQMRAVFADFELDSFLDVQQPLIFSLFYRTLRALFDWIGGAADLPVVIGWLRSGLTAIDLDEVDAFENYCLANGLLRQQRIFDEARYDTGAEGAEARAFRAHWLDPVAGFVRHFRKARRVRDKLVLLVNWLQGESQIWHQLAQRTDSASAAGQQDVAGLLTRSWNLFVDLVDEAADLLGPERMASATLCEILWSGLAAKRLNTIPLGLDRIRIGDLQQMAHYPCRVLFITGATRERFPPLAPPEGLLHNTEREEIRALSGKMLPNRSRDLARSNDWLLQTLLSLPQDQLILSSPSLKTEEVSAPQLRLEALGGSGQVRVLRPDDPPDVRWNSVRRAGRLLAKNGTSRQRESAAWRRQRAIWRTAWLQQLGDLPAAPGDLRDDPARLFLQAHEVLPLITAVPALSVSRLQTYRRCPYQYLMQYVLNLQERRLFIVDSRSTGSLLHHMMELAVLDLQLRLRRAGADSWQAELAAWHDGINPHYTAELYRRARDQDRLYRDELLDKIYGPRLQRLTESALLVTAESYLTQPYRPVAQEWAFPNPAGAEADGLQLEVDGVNMQLRGLIDRVDVSPDGAYRLVDYKSSDQSEVLQQLYHGLNLQLPLYALAWQTAHPKQQAAEWQHQTLRDIRTTTSEQFTAVDSPARVRILQSLKPDVLRHEQEEMDLALLSQYAKKQAEKALGRMLDGDFAARPAALENVPAPCVWCAFGTHCQFDRETLGSRLQLCRKIAAQKKDPSTNTPSVSAKAMVMRAIAAELEASGTPELQAEERSIPSQTELEVSGTPELQADARASAAADDLQARPAQDAAAGGGRDE